MGKADSPSLRERMLLLFHHVPSPVKPPNSSCSGLQVSWQPLLQPDRGRPAVDQGAAEEGEQGLGWGEGRRGRLRRSATPGCFPGPLPDPRQAAPALARPAFCPVTWFPFQNVTGSCWPLAPAINTLRSGGAVRSALAPAAASRSKLGRRGGEGESRKAERT